MHEVIDRIVDFLREYSIEIVVGILGGLGSMYATEASGIEFNRKQKVFRFVSGAVTAVGFTALIYQAVLYFTEVHLNGLSMAFLGYMNGFLGVEGVTRWIVNTVKAKRKKEEE